MQTIDLLRSLGERGTAPEIVDPAIAELRTTYGPTKDAARLEQALFSKVNALINSFPECIADTVAAKTAKEAFEKDFEALRRASRAGLSLQIGFSGKDCANCGSRTAKPKRPKGMTVSLAPSLPPLTSSVTILARLRTQKRI
ncbi:hypothetical protein [Sinorhizobium psoraleae]|uniref:Uncharacterized protein n=1 Tax=Sinorhizobium psoraleae TaxID=520838 RepID=A0ABT4KBK2_9HYPH|nr:hypothetical protein [Sinorhizobium psoraleae]MCZ4088741.1 hypothetical protein [Sinorhizobium psoraleae]